MLRITRALCRAVLDIPAQSLFSSLIIQMLRERAINNVHMGGYFAVLREVLRHQIGGMCLQSLAGLSQPTQRTMVSG